MAVFKINKTKDYTVMSNNHLKERKMSLKAKGLLSIMLSLPNNWDYSVNGLVAICKENETSINSALKELKEFGYLKVEKLLPNQTKTGRIEYVYNIFEKPQQAQKQDPGFLGVEILGVENKGQLNTNNKVTNNNNNNNNVGQSHDNAINIIDYLNLKAGTRFKPVNSNLNLIKARLKDYTIEELKAVIDLKVKEWKGTKMQQYIRPQTLFNATKFESYIGGLKPIVENNFDKPKSREYSKEEFENLFDDLEEVTV